MKDFIIILLSAVLAIEYIQKLVIKYLDRKIKKYKTIIKDNESNEPGEWETIIIKPINLKEMFQLTDICVDKIKNEKHPEKN